MDTSKLFDVKVHFSIPMAVFYIPSLKFEKQGKVILVTGGAKGIGRMISEGFVANGAKVYISSRDAKACEQACKELNALGKSAVPSTDRDSCTELRGISHGFFPSSNQIPANTNILIGKGSAHAIPADFYKVEDCKKMAAELAKRESKLDVLVNNSGSNWGAPFSEVRASHSPTKSLKPSLFSIDSCA